MRRAILRALAIGLVCRPIVAAAETPPPVAAPSAAPSSAPLAPLAPPARLGRRALRHSDPLTELGAGAILGGTAAIIVLIACAAGGVEAGPPTSTCVAASGFSALGLFAAGIPMVMIARSRDVAWSPSVDRVTFTAGARGGAVGWSWTF